VRFAALLSSPLHSFSLFPIFSNDTAVLISFYRFNESDVVDRVQEERERKLKELAKSPDIYEKLTRSIGSRLHRHNLLLLSLEIDGVLCCLPFALISPECLGIGRCEEGTALLVVWRHQQGVFRVWNWPLQVIGPKKRAHPLHK
jgi:hypothetical protein